MGILKNIFRYLDIKNKKRFIRQNPILNMQYEMQTRIRDGLIKKLLVYRLANSNIPTFKNMRESILSELGFGQTYRIEEILGFFVEELYKTSSEMDLLRFPESTIATISEAYHMILRNDQHMDKTLIFQMLDKQRNSNHLKSFRSQELNLENYIIHVLKSENRNDLDKLESDDFLKKQIKIADNFGMDTKARQVMLNL